MDPFGKALDGLYVNFVLRDVAGKILPGLIVIFGIKTAISAPSQLAIELVSFGWGGTLLLTLSAWLVGLVVQNLGEAVGWKTREKGKTSLVRMFRALQGPEHQQWERTVVLKEASRNVALSLIILFVAIGLDEAVSRAVGHPKWRFLTFESVAVLIGWVASVYLLILQSQASAKGQYEIEDEAVALAEAAQGAVLPNRTKDGGASQ